MPKPAARGLWPAILASFLLLSGCASYGSLFSFGRDSPQVVSATADPSDQSCLRTADQRTDDAVMADYAVAGSADARQIHDIAYRNCEKWRRHREE
jgi:hypothetical protein